jgi:toxin ParE1/3/4
MALVLKREIAKRDLIRHFVYLAESASLETARRFKEATRRTLIQLSQAPEIGSPGKVSEGTFAGVRCGVSTASINTSSPIASSSKES